MEVESFGFKMISYPDYFTNALFEGVAPSVRGFHKAGDVRPIEPARYPGDAKDMGGLLGQMPGEGTKID
jgi:hypothetical protein